MKGTKERGLFLYYRLDCNFTEYTKEATITTVNSVIIYTH